MDAFSWWTCRTVVSVANATETPKARMSERSARRGAIAKPPAGIKKINAID